MFHGDVLCKVEVVLHSIPEDVDSISDVVADPVELIFPEISDLLVLPIKTVSLRFHVKFEVLGDWPATRKGFWF